MSLDKVEIPDDLPAADLLRVKGLRATGPRVAILEALRIDRHHPTPEQIFTRLREEHPSLSLSTVYQTLEVFLAAGLCRRVNAGDGRLRVDGTAHDHDHAVCRHCGAVSDVARDAHHPSPVPALPSGMELLEVRVEYDVVCAACASGGSG